MSNYIFDRNIFSANVSVDKLRIGDILSHDVYLRNGTLLINAGTKLSDKKVQKLKKLKNKIVTLDLNKIYYRGVQASKNLFKDVIEGQVLEKKTVEKILDPFIDEIKREKDIVKLLGRLQSKDDYTFQHTVKIGMLVMVLGGWLGLSETDLHRLILAGTLHDIGKSQIPLSILNKPGLLTAEEFETMKLHTIYGYELLDRSDEYDEEIKKGILQHHERLDGSGYPYHLKNKDIQYFARIIAVVDIYHAMTTTRIYREKKDPFNILNHLRQNISGLDASIVFVFINNMVSMLQECQVVLNNGMIGDVIYVDKEFINAPLIKIVDSTEVFDLRVRDDIEIVDVIYDE
ncbi:MAG: HD-GYP domain-containing protein [Clostridia bacterium]|nr:HD-GYP domain-containing protein [Clostridia bacterium]MDD4048185.1 HD-GYP domain-containing protein [Clostridia bacterium]